MNNLFLLCHIGSQSRFSPILASATMSFSSVSVISMALLLGHTSLSCVTVNKIYSLRNSVLKVRPSSSFY